MNGRIKSKLILSILFLGVLLLSFWFSASRQNSVTLLAAEHQSDRPIPTAIAMSEPATPVTTEVVNYATVNGQEITGYYARPENASEPNPGIIAIHEWWGLNENIEAMARRLAGEGYQVLAVDMYGGQVAETPERAKQLVQSVEEDSAKNNLEQAYEYLTTEQRAPTVGVIGWCFGGSWSLQTALLLPQGIDATVIYYGGQIGEATPEQLATLQMPILGIFGAEDSSIPVSTVREFESTLNELGKQADIQIYENAGHAFANPSGDRYVPEAAEEAWNETTEFLAQHLKV